MEDKTANDKIFDFGIKNENVFFPVFVLHLLVGTFFLSIFFLTFILNLH